MGDILWDFLINAFTLCTCIIDMADRVGMVVACGITFPIEMADGAVVCVGIYTAPLSW